MLFGTPFSCEAIVAHVYRVVTFIISMVGMYISTLVGLLHFSISNDLGVSDSQFAYTALICAAACGRTECVRLLIDAGADKNAANNVR